MKTNIEKAINYLQLYRMDKNPDYLVMAHREIKKEVDQRKKAKDAGTSKARVKQNIL